tara:strand:- start:255 stop:1058 length:804 start_codon:yes stop_codon:yes gene_type:complete
MATLNLGRIKPVFKGAYDNSTAYVVDDIVTSGGSSYICIAASTGNAVSNATYWTQMAAGGTDVGTTLTTQGDILYRDGSGLQRLAKGTSGQVLKQGTNHPEWGTDAGGKIGQVLQTVSQNTHSINPGANTWAAFTNLYITVTPTATSSKIWIGFNGLMGQTNWSGLRIYRKIGSGSYSHLSAASGNSASNRSAGLPVHGYSYNDTNTGRMFNVNYLDSPNTTDAVSYQLWGITHDSNQVFIGRSAGDSDHTGVIRASTFLNAWEILA